MTVRVVVQPDLTIEIQRPNPQGKNSRFINCKNLDSAMRIIRFLLKRDLERAERTRFVPQIEREAKQALKTLNERNPYNGQR